MLLLKVLEYSQQQYKSENALKTAVTSHPCLLLKISFSFYIVSFFKIADDLSFLRQSFIFWEHEGPPYLPRNGGCSPISEPTVIHL